MDLPNKPDDTDATITRLQQELQTKNRQLELVLDNLSIAAYELDAEGVFLLARGKGLAKLGWQPDEPVGLSLFDLYADYPQLADAARRALAGAPQIQEVEIGDTVWETHLIPLLNESGGVERVFGTAVDVTESRRSETALRRSEAVWRAIFNNTLQAFLLFDPERRLLALNRVAGYLAIETLGRELQVGERADELFAAFDFVGDFLRFFDNALQGKMIRDQRQVEAEGHSYWFDADYNPVIADDGTIVGVSLSVLDVTSRKQAERALQDSEAQLRHIIDSVPEGVLLLDTGGQIMLANPIAEQFLAVLAPSRPEGSLRELGDHRLAQLLTSPPKGLWHEINAGSRYYEAIARPVENSAYSAGWVLVLRDVTQEREIQRRLQEQERLAAVGQLAAGMAHDFNNILAVIVLYSQIMLRATDLPARARERVHTIEQQAQRAAELIQQVLDFSRQSVLARRPLNLVNFLQELVELLSRTLPETVRIDLQYQEDEYVVHVDPSRMQQVIVNLALNARDAMPAGGLLRLSLSRLQLEPESKPPVPGMEPGPWVVMGVSDSGSGIAPEAISHIYEPFFTTKESGKGAGLGLSQVYGIVRQHSGHIDVQTAADQGTAFFIYLPAAVLDSTVAAGLESATLPQGQGQTVLVVEDNQATRQALVDTMRLLNYQVVEAANGREALVLLRSDATQIDLVVSDVVMPEMGGIALLHAMEQHDLDIPLLLVTGHPLTKELEQLAAHTRVTYLPKPLSMADLAHALARHLSPGL